MSNSRGGKSGTSKQKQYWVLKRRSGEEGADMLNLKKKYANAGLSVPNYIQSSSLLIQDMMGFSDASLKKDIADITEDDVAKISLLSPKQYKFINDKNKDKKHFGLIAQEVEKIYPNLICKTSNGKMAVNYLEIIPLLLLKIQDLERQIKELK